MFIFVESRLVFVVSVTQRLNVGSEVLRRPRDGTTCK